VKSGSKTSFGSKRPTLKERALENPSGIWDRVRVGYKLKR